jgi:hypothetical protein
MIIRFDHLGSAADVISSIHPSIPSAQPESNHASPGKASARVSSA